MLHFVIYWQKRKRNGIRSAWYGAMAYQLLQCEGHYWQPKLSSKTKLASPLSSSHQAFWQREVLHNRWRNAGKSLGSHQWTTPGYKKRSHQAVPVKSLRTQNCPTIPCRNAAMLWESFGGHFCWNCSAFTPGGLWNWLCLALETRRIYLTQVSAKEKQQKKRP